MGFLQSFTELDLCMNILHTTYMMLTPFTFLVKNVEFLKVCSHNQQVIVKLSIVFCFQEKEDSDDDGENKSSLLFEKNDLHCLEKA